MTQIRSSIFGILNSEHRGTTVRIAGTGGPRYFEIFSDSETFRGTLGQDQFDMLISLDINLDVEDFLRSYKFSQKRTHS